MTEIRVEFPQYVAQMEFVGEPPNGTIIVRCPFCKREVLRRTWLGFERPAGPEIPETHPLVQSRLADSYKDREVYWRHLVTAHPERFR